MKKGVIIVSSVIIALIIITVLVLGYFGFIPGIAKLLGTDDPRDLGVTYTEEDLDAALAQSKAKTVSVDSGKSIAFKGSHDMDLSLTSAQITAVANQYPDIWADFPVDDVQVLLNDDGTAEVAGLLRVNRLVGYVRASGQNVSEQDIQAGLDALRLTERDSVPFYVIGTFAVDNNTTSTLEINKLEIGRFPVPTGLFDAGMGEAMSFVNDQIADFGGLSLDRLRIDGGKLEIDGTVPDEIVVSD